uniref:Late embryogenesis abundant protein LEA-2 subgroup domain-containing protein n=1 Tax=Kalanchoe fedtschenkoi TaxID=63787 RepID=A0A7N0ZTZ6_KALFE
MERRGGVKTCGILTLILVLIIVVVVVALAFTLFKVKDPEVFARPLGKPDIQLSFFPKLGLNATLDLEITIRNRNHGSFKYEDSTAYVFYHGDIMVAQFPMLSRNVPSRGEISTRASVSIIGDKLVSNFFFLKDVALGSLNFTSDAALHGKVRLLKVFKFKAVAYSTCDISMFVATESVVSTCKVHMKV